MKVSPNSNDVGKKNLMESEWRKELSSASFWGHVFAEFIGTLYLVSVQVATVLKWSPSGLGGVVQVSLAMGFIVCCQAWTVGDFGGGHLNPAVTFAFVVSLKITVFRAITYTITQCIGGIAGAALIYGLTPKDFRDNLAATTLHPNVNAAQGVFIEAWITCQLVLTILGSTNQKRKGNVYMATIPIGFSIAIGLMSAFASTGGSMNPARSLGPAIIASIWDDHWVYWIGPYLGSGIAVAIYTLLQKSDPLYSQVEKSSPPASANQRENSPPPDEILTSDASVQSGAL